MSGSTARFKIRNLTTAGAWSPSTDGGFDCDDGDELELQLEDSPALDIWITTFSCTDKSNGRSAPTFDPVSGTATTPTTGVSMTMPGTERGTWAIQCMVNGGGDGSDEEAAQYTFTRYVAVRTANLDLRHPLAGETTQYVDPGGWAVALQELLDAVDTAAPGAVPATRTLLGTAPIRIDGGASGDLSADRTIAFIPNANVAMGGYGFTGIPSLANASGAFSLTTGGGAITVDASAGIDIGISIGTLVRIGRTGQTVRLPALGGGGAGYVAVDNAGNLSFSAGAGGLDALTGVLEDTATALNANGVPIQALSSQLVFSGTPNALINLIVTSAAPDSPTDVLAIGITPSGPADIAGGAGIVFHGTNDASAYATYGRIQSRVVNPAAASFTTELGFQVTSQPLGGDVETLTLLPTGIAAVFTGLDRISAGALSIGASVATSVAVTPATSIAGALTVGSSIDRIAAGALGLGGANATSITSTVGGALQHTLTSAAMTWAEGLTTPTITQATRTSDAATTELRFTAQAPLAGATGTNRNAGSIRHTVPSPAAGGAEGYFYFTLSGADVVRIGRPNGNYETEIRYSNASVVHRNATISGGTIELWTGGLIVSTSNIYHRDSSQTLRYTRAISTAIADTYDASNTAITETFAQDGSAAGATWTRTGQRGATGFAGGSLAFNVGEAGTLGTNAPGNLDVGLGTPASSVTGKQRWMTVQGTAVIAQIGLGSGAYALLEAGAAASSGWYITGPAAQTVASGVISVESTGAQFWINTVAAETRYYDSGTLARTDKSVNGGASSIQWSGVTTSATVSIAAPAGAGVTGGRALNFAAGAGQQQTGANDNTSGGKLTLASGAAGTGGSGAAGTSGDVEVYTGATVRLTVHGDGSKIASTVRVDAPRFVGTPDTPASASNLLTISLTTSQNPEHTTTENTTVTVTGGTEGQTGTILFTQGGTGRTITMPTNGVGVEYDNTIGGLGVTAIIDTTALTRTLLAYRILANGKAYIYARSVNTIP